MNFTRYRKNDEFYDFSVDNDKRSQRSVHSQLEFRDKAETGTGKAGNSTSRGKDRREGIWIHDVAMKLFDRRCRRRKCRASSRGRKKFEKKRAPPRALGVEQARHSEELFLCNPSRLTRRNERAGEAAPFVATAFFFFFFIGDNKTTAPGAFRGYLVSFTLVGTAGER